MRRIQNLCAPAAFALVLLVSGAGSLRALPADAPVPALVVAKAGPRHIAAGGSAQFTIAVTNTGGATATGVIVTDTLPAPLRLAGVPDGGTEIAPGVVRWDLGSLPPGERRSLSLAARLPVTASAATLTNQVDAVQSEPDPDPDDNAASWTSDVVTTDLGVEITAGATQVQAGDVLTHVVRLANPSTAAAEDVAVEVRLDDGTMFVTDTLSVFGPGSSESDLPTGRRWRFDRLAAETNVEIDLVTRVRDDVVPGGTISHTVVVTSTTRDDRPDDNGRTAAPVPILPGPPSSLAATPDAAEVVVGTPVLLTVEVRDRFGHPVADGTPVTAFVQLGTVTPSPALTAGGRATIHWTCEVTGPARATVTAGSASQTVEARFTPAPPGAVSLVARPATIGVGGRSTLTATVLDRFGNIVADGTPVAFTAQGGRLIEPTAITVAGVATSTYRAASLPGTFAIVATARAARAESRVTLRPTDLIVVSRVTGPRGAARESRTYPGEHLTYVIAVRNRDLATARGVYLATAVAQELEITSIGATAPITPTDDPPPGLTAGSTQHQVRGFWSLPDIAPGEGVTLTIAGALDRDSEWDAFQTLFFRSVITTTTSEATPMDMAHADQAGVYSADYFVGSTLNWPASSVQPGGSLAYEVSFGDRAFGDQTPVRITDTLPAGTTFGQWQPDPRTSMHAVSGTEGGAREVVWEVDAGSERSGSFLVWLTIDEDVAPQSVIENVLTIGSPLFDRDLTNNRATDGGIRLQGVNLVAEVRGPQTVAPGDVVRYEVSVTNRASVDVATHVVVHSTPPRGYAVVASDPPGETLADGRIRWVRDRLLVGSEFGASVEVAVPEDVPIGTVLRHSVDASADEPESVPDDNHDDIVTSVVPGDPASVTVTSTTRELLACGPGTVDVTADVRDRVGHPVADGALVRWSATLGALSHEETPTVEGRATVRLSASTAVGQAVVTARAGQVAGGTQVRMVAGPPVALSVTADPAEAVAGGTATITVIALDACANPVADGWPVHLETTRGSFQGGGRSITLETLDSRVRAVLRVGSEAGSARVTATYDQQFGETVVSVRALPEPDRHAVCLPLVLRD